MSTISKIKIPGALRKLYRYGSDALKPTKIMEELPTKRQRWQKPLVSKRVANTLRKKAIRNGTFGTYDPETGVGWDKHWDVGSDTTSSSENMNKHTLNEGQLEWMNLRPRKETKRERTREARAKKIEGMLTTADDKILEYRLAEQAKKPIPGVETTIKKLSKVKK